MVPKAVVPNIGLVGAGGSFGVVEVGCEGRSLGVVEGTWPNDQPEDTFDVCGASFWSVVLPKRLETEGAGVALCAPSVDGGVTSG